MHLKEKVQAESDYAIHMAMIALKICTSNDDLRNRNGLKSRREQEQLEEEIKDVQDQNSKLQIQVNKSSVQAVDEAYKNKEKQKNNYGH